MKIEDCRVGMKLRWRDDRGQMPTIYTVTAVRPPGIDLAWISGIDVGRQMAASAYYPMGFEPCEPPMMLGEE